MELTRRGFLTGAAMAATGAVAAGAMAAQPATQANAAEATAPTAETMAANANGDYVPTWTWEVPPAAITDDQIAETYDYDIVICGAGISSGPAALYAAQQGAKVVVLEKAGKVMNKRLHTMGFNARCQKEAGIEFDRTETLRDFWNITNAFQGRLSLYARFFDNSGPFIDWLEEQMATIGCTLLPGMPSFAAGGGGVQFWNEYPTPIFFGEPGTGNITVNGSNWDWAEAIADLAKNAGAEYVFHTPVRQLVRGGVANGTEGRVEGVIAQREDGSYVRYNASKGVLLATGDFGMNEEMLRAFNPTLLKVVDTVAEPNNVGDGHMMAMWVGADMDAYAGGDLFPMNTTTDCADLRPLPSENPALASMQELGWRPAVANLQGLIVDMSGRRVGTEDMVFQSFSHVILSTPNGRVYGIFDGAWHEKYKDFGYAEVDLMAINTQEEVDKEVERGIIHKYDTLDELCAGEGFDPDVFNETIQIYNDASAAGEDRQFLKAPKYLASIDTAPFYVAEMGVAMTSTRGGLKIDDHINVMDKKGTPIPGLYAAGNTAGSFYGHIYPPNMPGSGIGHGQTFGWIAVKDMLGEDYL
ncbi:MAG: FAD-binding protein [Coriobacteriia bacterium]|nr:FAD-binding protein [Coriobacteriia bacterium]